MRSRIHGRQISVCRSDPTSPAASCGQGTNLGPRHDRGAWPSRLKAQCRHALSDSARARGEGIPHLDRGARRERRAPDLPRDAAGHPGARHCQAQGARVVRRAVRGRRRRAPKHPRTGSGFSCTGRHCFAPEPKGGPFCSPDGGPRRVSSRKNSEARFSSRAILLQNAFILGV
jgi:hypothetical protein